MSSMNVSKSFSVAGRNQWLQIGLFCRKYSLNSYTVLCFSEIKEFSDHYEVTTYVECESAELFGFMRIARSDANW